MNSLSRRLVAVAAIVLAVGVASLVGVGSSRAAVGFNPVLSQYVSNTGNTIGTVTYGGAIGFHLDVQSTGDSNATHVQIVVTSTGGATFLDSNDPTCAAAKGDPGTMVCIPLGGTFNSGADYSVDFRFTAPASGDSVTTAPSVVIAAQSVGGKNHGTNGTTKWPGNSITTPLTPSDSTTDTFLRGKDGTITTGGPQTFAFGLPSGLIGNPFAVAVGVQNQTGTPICGTCLPTFTTLHIPTATFVSKDGNPFYNGVDPNAPYTWTMSASYPSGFQLHGVWHVPDASGGSAGFIPSCASIGGAPTAAAPVCWDTLQQINNKKIVTATGRGLENGSGGFG